MEQSDGEADNDMMEDDNEELANDNEEAAAEQEHETDEDDWCTLTTDYCHRLFQCLHYITESCTISRAYINHDHVVMDYSNIVVIISY